MVAKACGSSILLILHESIELLKHSVRKPVLMSILVSLIYSLKGEYHLGCLPLTLKGSEGGSC